MGFKKQMKDMKDLMSAAPDMVDQAQQMQQQAMAQQAGAGAMMGGPVEPELLEPIEGISLELYARMAKTVGAKGLDEEGTKAMVEANGHTYEAWRAAYDGWNARFKENMNLSTRYGMLYQQAEPL